MGSGGSRLLVHKKEEEEAADRASHSLSMVWRYGRELKIMKRDSLSPCCFEMIFRGHFDVYLYSRHAKYAN